MNTGREVLVIEDEPNMRLLLTAIAQFYGFHSTLATDGAEALRLLNSGRNFVVVLLDLLLPNMNGFEVLRHLRCTNPDALRKVIVLTAATSITTQDCAELSEVWRFIHKPFDVEDLALQMMSCSAEQARRKGSIRTSGPDEHPLVPGNDATARDGGPAY